MKSWRIVMVFLLFGVFLQILPLQVGAEDAPSQPTLDVQVMGLFQDAAMLDINGDRVLLKAGETGPQGVRLIKANSDLAEVEIKGIVQQLFLTRRLSSRFAAPERRSVSIARNNNGHYMVVGSINDQIVRFMVDTGASTIALNSNIARQLGLTVDTAKPVKATTAGGQVTAWPVTLDSVSIGTIRLNNVKAAVIEGDYPPDVLLGMSFLNQVEMRETAGILLLESNL